MHTCRRALVAISFLTFSFDVAAAHPLTSERCESVEPASSAQQPLRIAPAASPEVAGDSTSAPILERRALDEMLRGDHAAPLRWERVPELVILTSVMMYETHGGTTYRATGEQLTDEEADALAGDLVDALAVLTDGFFARFAAVRYENPSAGEMINVMRPGQLVVGRYKGVRDKLATIGFGGRSTRGATIRGGSIILDSDYDRTNAKRALLRMHELGHTLGYNHVLSRASIMNPRIGSELTDFDRMAVRVASQRRPAQSPACT